MATGDSGCEAYTVIAWSVGLSHERSDIAGAESFYSLEGNMCGTVTRGADARRGLTASNGGGELQYLRCQLAKEMGIGRSTQARSRIVLKKLTLLAAPRNPLDGAADRASAMKIFIRHVVLRPELAV